MAARNPTYARGDRGDGGRGPQVAVRGDGFPPLRNRTKGGGILEEKSRNQPHDRTYSDDGQ